MTDSSARLYTEVVPNVYDSRVAPSGLMREQVKGTARDRFVSDSLRSIDVIPNNKQTADAHLPQLSVEPDFFKEGLCTTPADEHTLELLVESSLHSVRRGETISSIARQKLGMRVTNREVSNYGKFVVENNHIQNPKTIAVGKLLYLPAIDTTGAIIAPSSDPAIKRWVAQAESNRSEVAIDTPLGKAETPPVNGSEVPNSTTKLSGGSDYAARPEVIVPPASEIPTAQPANTASSSDTADTADTADTRKVDTTESKPTDAKKTGILGFLNGVGAVAYDLAAGCVDEVVYHPVELIEDAAIGAAATAAVTFLAPEVAIGVGLVGVAAAAYKIGKHGYQWLQAADVVANPQGHSEKEEIEAHQTVKGIGQGIAEIVAGAAGGAAVFRATKITATEAIREIEVSNPFIVAKNPVKQQVSAADSKNAVNPVPTSPRPPAQANLKPHEEQLKPLTPTNFAGLAAVRAAAQRRASNP